MHIDKVKDGNDICCASRLIVSTDYGREGTRGALLFQKVGEVR